MAPSVFIGVVTHPRTRFPESSGPAGLAAMLGSRLREGGYECDVHIEANDAWSPELLALTRDAVSQSIEAEMNLERRWRDYLRPGKSSRLEAALLTVRRSYRRLKYLRPLAKWTGRDADAGAAMVRRLINIEIAHLSLLQQAVDAGSDWVLILEDDAHAEIEEAHRAVSATIEHPQSQDIAFVNLSRSFTESQLGIDHLLTDGGPLPDCPPVRVMKASRPVTNTVCAVLYRGGFLRENLWPEVSEIPLSPVVPIDWKLNAALMNLAAKKSVPSGACWFLVPAPIVQGSMHPQRAGKTGPA